MRQDARVRIGPTTPIAARTARFTEQPTLDTSCHGSSGAHDHFQGDHTTGWLAVKREKQETNAKEESHGRGRPRAFAAPIPQ